MGQIALVIRSNPEPIVSPQRWASGALFRPGIQGAVAAGIALAFGLRRGRPVLRADVTVTISREGIYTLEYL